MACAHETHSCCGESTATVGNPCCCTEQAPESAGEAPLLVRSQDPIYPAVRCISNLVPEQKIVFSPVARSMRASAPRFCAKLYLINRSLLI